MALARIACGNCGASVAAGQKQCPQCGASVEFVQTQHSCPSCGHVNANPGNFCESCGTRLVSQGSPDTVGKGPAPRRKMDPTHLIVGTIGSILLSYFVYSEVIRPFPNEIRSEPPSRQPSTHQDHPDYESEIARLEQLVDAHQHDSLMVLQLANRLHDAGMTEPRYLPRALNAYTRYLSMSPSDLNARVDRGICYFEMGRIDSTRSDEYFQKAISEMESVSRSHPKHQSAAFNLGIVHLFAGDMARSTEWFSRTVKINPESDLGKRAGNLLKQHSTATNQ